MGNNLYSNLVNFYNVNDENFKEFMAEIYKEMLTTHRDVQYVKEHLTEEIEKKLEIYLVDGKFNINIEEKVNEFLENNQEIKNINLQLEQKVYYFNTVSEMKNSSKLKEGSFVITKGYYSVNDGGGSSYNIIPSDSSITCNDGNYISLKNNLIAVLIIDNERIHLKQFGCKADGITDDTQKIQNAFNCQGVKYIDASREDVYLVSLTLTLISKSFNGNYAKFICSTSSNFTDDYIIKATYSTYGSNDFSGNYIKNLRLINYINDVFVLNNVHGILLTGCANVDNIYGDGLNRIVKFTNEYSDYQTATKINSMRKKGDEYTVEMGYLGDAKVIDYVHHAYSQGQNNAVKVSGGMLPIKIRNIVNGNVLIQDSMAQLSDCHFEDGNVVIKNANVILNTLYLWGGNKIKIQGDSHAELNNIAFSHNLKENNPIEYDIEIDKTSEVAFNNVFRRSLGTYIDFVKKSNTRISTTDGNLTNFFNLNSGILANSCVIANNRLLNQYSFNVGSDIQIINLLATDPNGRWFKDTGNYVYRAICLIDIDRKIGRLNTNSYYQTVSVTDTNRAVLIMFRDTFVPTRIFRGTSSSSYDSYIDIAPKSENLLDCGTHINGTPWKERTPGVADNINNVTSITYVNGGKNVEVYMSGMPSVGKWKKHDKVFIENPVAGGYIGWVCIADGDFSETAPTFKKFSQLET